MTTTPTRVAGSVVSGGREVKGEGGWLEGMAKPGAKVLAMRCGREKRQRGGCKRSHVLISRQPSGVGVRGQMMCALVAVACSVGPLVAPGLCRLLPGGSGGAGPGTGAVRWCGRSHGSGDGVHGPKRSKTVPRAGQGSCQASIRLAVKAALRMSNTHNGHQLDEPHSVHSVESCKHSYACTDREAEGTRA